MNRWLLIPIFALGCSIEGQRPDYAPAMLHIEFSRQFDGPVRAGMIWRESEDGTFFISSDSPVTLDGTIGSFELQPPALSLFAEREPDRFRTLGSTPKFSSYTLENLVFYQDDGDERLTLPHPGQIDTSPDTFLGGVSNTGPALLFIQNFDAWFSELTQPQLELFYEFTAGRYTPIVATYGYALDPSVDTQQLYFSNDPVLKQVELMCADQPPERDESADTISGTFIDPRIVDGGALRDFQLVCESVDDVCALADLVPIYEAFMARPGRDGGNTPYCYEYSFSEASREYQQIYLSAQFYQCSGTCPCTYFNAAVSLITFADDPPPGWPCTLEEAEEVE